MSATYPKFTDRESELLDGAMGPSPPTTALERELYVIIHKLFNSNGAAILWAHRWKKCATLLRRAAEQAGVKLDLHAIEREDRKRVREAIAKLTKKNAKLRSRARRSKS